MKNICGKKAIVTGAASGIGRAIALALADQGADLFLVDIDDTALAKTVAEAAAHGVEVIGTRCDVTSQDEIARAVEKLLERWGYVDILINNAGVAYYGPTDRMTSAQWTWLMNINLMAPIHLTSRLLPTLLSRPDAHVLNVCSISGLVAGGRFTAYHVSKFGLVGFTEALRAEYGRRGLGVTALCPGPVRTKLYTSAISGKKDKPVPSPPAWICTTEEKVAVAAMKALHRNSRMVLLTPLAHVVWNVKKFAPWLLDWMNHLGRKKKRKQIAADQMSHTDQNGSKSRSRAA